MPTHLGIFETKKCLFKLQRATNNEKLKKCREKKHSVSVTHVKLISGKQ